MNKTETEKYRQILLAEGRKILEKATAHRAEVQQQSGGDAQGSLSHTPFHLADLADDQFEQQIAVEVLRTEHEMLGEINSALERIKAGNFGICEDCGQEIARERLEAIPYTRFCVKCAAARET